MRRDADGKLYCPDEGDGKCSGELERGNRLGKLAAAARSARKPRPPDGIVRIEEYPTTAILAPPEGYSVGQADLLTVSGSAGDGVTQVRVTFGHPHVYLTEPVFLGYAPVVSGVWTLSAIPWGYIGPKSIYAEAYGATSPLGAISLPVRILVTP